MGKITFSIVLICLFTHGIHAQKEANTWYFGGNAGLDFNSGSPVAITDGQVNSSESCAAISDASGNLLFYTDGIKVWTRNHTVMPNGIWLWGHQSSSQGAIIVPKPGSSTLYYIFTLDGQAGFYGLRYSVVDMTLNGGLGDVTDLNVPVYTASCEKISVVPHANNSDYWIVTHGWDNNEYNAHLLTAAGLSGTPVVSSTGVVVYDEWGTNNYGGCMKISPDGTKIAAAHSSALGTLQLCDFNTSTGVVSNAQTLLVIPGFIGGSLYGVEFSPNSNVLYATSHELGAVYQFDLTAADIPASKQVLAEGISATSALQLGPDGKIYLSVGDVDKLSVINNPDIVGTGCNLQFNTVDLAGKIAQYGLPSFVASLFRPDSALEMPNACVGEIVAPQINSSQTILSSVWDFGDGSPATPNPGHAYASAGTFDVSVMVTTASGVRVLSKQVVISSRPVAQQPGDLIACNDSTNPGTAAFDLRSQDAAILGAQLPNDIGITYHSSNEDATAGANSLPNSFTNTSNPQSIYARVTNTATGCFDITTFNVSVNPPLVIDMPNRFSLCRGSAATLTAPAGFDSYQWSTGDVTRSIQITAAGEYTLTVFKTTGSQTCDATKRITVVLSEEPVITQIKVSDWTENDNSIAIAAAPALGNEYSIDGINYQANPVFEGLASGRYTVYVRNDCGITQQEVLLLMYPRFFTPNGDGYNETWRIPYAQFEPGMTVNVFDRYGKLITSFKGEGPGWDGRLNGSLLPSTDYWFTVKRQDGSEHKGHFSMLR